MTPKLTEITTKYHTFVENQVLTDVQLNEFIEYFDDQDRLTRAFLIGVGTVCGFEVSRSGANIVLTQGVGITTDGDLLQLKEEGVSPKKLVKNSVTYSHYKKFDDNEAAYAPFRKLVGSEELTTTVMDLYEILPTAVENSSPLSELPNLNEMAVLLYLESYADDGDLCTAIDCDNQGIAQINRLRVLLVSKADAEYIAANDSIFSAHNKIDQYFDLPSVAVRRVVLNQINTSKYEELKRAYHTAINSDDLLKNLSNGISLIVKNFGGLLQLGISPATLNSTLNSLKAQFTFAAYKTPFDIQYRYDYLKDLVDTYDEIRQELLSLKEICSPDVNAFPKHLLLGLLSEINTVPKHLRHGFYRSPALSSCDKLEKVKSLVLRLLEQIKNYGIKVGAIKITPSNKLPELGKRSIPFYYNVGTAFLKNWDFSKTKIFREKFNLSYRTENLSTAPQIQNPLAFNTDSSDFLRIEGHQGKDYRDVLEELDDLKKEYGLSFDVKALSVNINTETLDIDDYECEFEDLKVMLKAWTSEQDCILAQVSSFFSGFSTRVPGANIKEAELDLKSNLKVASISTNYRSVDYNTTFLKEATVSKTKLLYQAVAGSSVISDNMSSVEDTLGVELKAAIDENKGGSANDIIASARTKLQEKINTEEWNAVPDIKDFVANKSVELMAHTYIITQRMPLAVHLVDTVKVRDYKLSLTQLCALVQKLKAGYQSTSLSVGLRAFIGLLINQLSTVCCSGKKMEVLLDEINNRKEQILLRLQLSKFIEQHPGLEHKAGVEPGGTFVLVYKNAEVSTDTGSVIDRVSDANIFSKVDLSASKSLLSNQLMNAEKLTFAERSTVLKSATEILNYESYINRIKDIQSLNRLIAPSSVPDNTVVADFALPYMCCSDCAPVNFIIAKQPATLRLERDKYCLLTDTEPILYEVSPADGVVAPNPAVDGVSVENGKIVILADAFPATQIGVPIKFTVDNQVTDAVLTVYAGIKADFSVPQEPTNQATHRFVVTGENLEGASYLWEFGDGATSSEATPSHTYKLPVNEENKVTVSLTVTASNGICKYTVEHDIAFVEIKPAVQLDATEYCANDKNEYAFAVSPENAQVVISGPGVIPNNAGGFSFIPAAATVGTFGFLVNGEDAGFNVTLFAPPVAGISPKQVGNQLIISNTSKNANKFDWSINGTPQSTTNLNPIVINLTPNSPTEWRIAQVAAGAAVCPVSRTSVGITTKYVEEPPVSNCVDEAKTAILRDLKILLATKPDEAGVIGNILVQTQSIYGGTSGFNKGVIDRIDEFLSGKANSEVQVMFEKLWFETFNMIIKTSTQPEIQKLLMILFELQIRLFYNVMGCQSNETLKAFGDILNDLLNQLVQYFEELKERKISFSEAMKAFIKNYAEKVADRLFLAEQTKFIVDNVLI
ncbi:PKD domain-containing protein [Maribellus sp. CM-23]|uniref:PKD domain-containing protein n=1 Tax=Maribellus sp. CM-23 TaxID=2781026 RepID=UPI001F1C363B|nr:PKD domain-containing protein [Maribellus sp. CM-23]